MGSALYNNNVATETLEYHDIVNLPQICLFTFTASQTSKMDTNTDTLTYSMYSCMRANLAGHEHWPGMTKELALSSVC